MATNFFKAKNGLNLAPIDTATIANPEIGDVIVDVNDSNKLKRYDSLSASWREIGSGSGTLNYILESDFETGTSNWPTYKDAVSEIPEDGTGGTALYVTFPETSVSPLRGLKSGLLTKSANNARGEGVSYNFLIDPADQAQILRVSFDYSSSANYADGDVRVYIYDVTNSQKIEVIDRDLLASAQGKYVGTFQTSSNSTSYRLIFHVASVNALAYTVEIDNVFVGQQTIVKGPIVTDWKTSSITSAITNTTIEAIEARNGENVIIKGTITFTGTPAGTFALNLPYPIDITKLSYNSSTPLGILTIGISSRYFGYVRYSSPTVGTLMVDIGSSIVTVSPTVPATFVTNSNLNFEISYPVVGWSSNTVLSEDAGNREIVCILSEALSQSLADNVTTKVAFTSAVNKINDTTNSWDTVNHRYNVPESGFYDIIGSIGFGSTGTTVRNIQAILYVNGVNVGNNTNNALNGNTGNVEISRVRYLNKGDYVELYTYQNDVAAATSFTATSARFIIAKRSSPQTIAASEVVAVRAASSSGAPITATPTTYVYESTAIDTHNAYNSSGIFTAPQSGFYNIKAALRIGTYTLSNTQLLLLEIVTSNSGTVQRGIVWGDGQSKSPQVQSDTTVFLSKGDTARVQVSTTINTASTNVSAYSTLSITKINGVS